MTDEVPTDELFEMEWDLIGLVCDQIDEANPDLPIADCQRIAKQIIALVRGRSLDVLLAAEAEYAEQHRDAPTKPGTKVSRPGRTWFNKEGSPSKDPKAQAPR